MMIIAIAIARNADILQPEDNVQDSAVVCARLRPDGNYFSNKRMSMR